MEIFFSHGSTLSYVRLTFTPSPLGGGDFGKESVVHRPPLPLLSVAIATATKKSHPRYGRSRDGMSKRMVNNSLSFAVERVISHAAAI